MTTKKEDNEATFVCSPNTTRTGCPYSTPTYIPYVRFLPLHGWTDSRRGPESCRLSIATPPPQKPMLSASHPHGGGTVSNVRSACRRLAGLHLDVLCSARLTGQSPLTPGRSWARGQRAVLAGGEGQRTISTHARMRTSQDMPPPPRRFRTAIPESHARLRPAVPRPPFLPPSPRAPSDVLRHSTRLDSVIVQTYSLLCSAAWDRTPTSCRHSAVTPSAPLLPANCRVLGGTRSIQKCRYIEQDTRLARVLRPPDLCSARSE